MEGSLSDASYQRVRTLLYVSHISGLKGPPTDGYRLEMADLLHRLETGLHRAAGASERLRSQVDRIDGYMRNSRLVNLPAAPPPPNGSAILMNIKPEPAIPPRPYAPTHPLGSTPAIGDQMLQFQLPPELLSDWPWPLDNSHSEGFLPLAFE